ncbi:MAG TPA: DUF72 domain-containing protein [Candidatus Deferrimicrobium sp.]|nr:DUF72 domain-containing protein [Candidatus Deferrimicrobium sp.]
MEVRVGTSGFSFLDWREVFYPFGVERGKMLDYYARYFSTVEINSTYYRVPHPTVMLNLVKKVPKEFDFMVKVPQSLTHRRTEVEDDLAKFRTAIKPMEETGKLAGLLAQFPNSFRFSAEALDYLNICREALSPNRLYVEFRHNSWENRTMYYRLREDGIGYVSVDEPLLDGLLKPHLLATTDVGYVRLHGRNAEHWWQGRERRYDYNYSEEELDQWVQKIVRARDKVKKMYVYFNNCYRGQAVTNAQAFARMLPT